MHDSRLKIVVVGGGFGGLKAALELAEDALLDVTLISDQKYFRYYPALYHTVTGGKESGSNIPLRNILEESEIRLVHARATKIDRKKKLLLTDGGKEFAYDRLVLALGTITNYFGIKGLPEHSFSIKTAEELEKLKKHLHDDLVKNGAPDENYVIVGGGPTGIELAGALPGYLHEIMKRHNIQGELHIKLIEAMPRLLPRSPEKISAAVAKRLEKLGVDIMLGEAVGGQTADMLMVGGQPLMSRTVIWTAGMANNPFFKENKFTLSQRGKVVVNAHLQAEPDIYVIGDNAETMYSGMAQTALHDGEFVARNIKRQTTNSAPEAYIPIKPITVIPVGPHWAAVEWGKLTLASFIGWFLRAAADFVAFTDITTWDRAGRQWMKTMGREPMKCPNCGPKRASGKE